ncbi:MULTISPECIES: TonB-dependent receptor [Roseobacteraceae]|uniref:TonB-dependent receptor n=1 Tax=Celeribacter baekdonensis B30 TaxID=1208323 RepID=K2JSZ0_9RHOB|nr:MULTISPECIES: TonB-dependent receptor [Roseobacteraceae]EKE73519.1 TonB-dependent receptor [Celeribacter baekdonensis B30]KAB6717582.1 TonB-dependent receptor [Roseobacter sp. TSBP12]
MNRFTVLAASAGLLSLSAPVAAQETFVLDEIIVTGGLSPIAAEKYGRAVSVVTAEDIEERGITTVQDALRALPGVSVNGTGTSDTQIRIRGGEGNHTLVLIDGIAAAGGDGEYIFSGLETANIERIEVLRGPQSVYYGSNASAGVINIITRKGSEGTTLNGSLEVGSGTTASTFVARRDARGGVSLALSHMDDPGFDLSGDGGEKDGLTRSTAILSGDYQATDALKLGFTLRRSEERYEYDSDNWMATDAESYIVDDPTQYANRDELTAGVFGEYSMMEGRLTHRLAVETTQNRLKNNGGATTKTTTDAVKYRLSYGIDGAVDQADQLLNLLLEHREDDSTLDPAYGRAATSVALEYRGSFASGLDVQAGARFDDNDVFKDATTWNLGLSYLLDNGVRLHGSAGEGVVNPAYFELYDSYGGTGNPDLQPERNLSFDLGVELPIFGDRGTVDVTLFKERLTDEITAVSTDPGYTYINQTGNSDRRGVEIAGALEATDALSLRLGYTYLEAKNPDNSVEIRRPRHELTLGGTLDAFGGRGAVSADLRHVAGNYDWGSNQTVKLPSFTTVNVAAHYDLTDRVQLTGRVENLFDAEATEVWGYATRGRAVYVGLNAQF